MNDKIIQFSDGLPSSEGGYLLHADNGLVFEATIDESGVILTTSFDATTGEWQFSEVEPERILGWSLPVATYPSAPQKWQICGSVVIKAVTNNDDGERKILDEGDMVFLPSNDTSR